MKTETQDPRLKIRSGKTPIRVHIGKALELFAAQYPTVMEVVYELVQNAIDAEAAQIRIRVNYNKRKERTLTVTDNGTGATPEMVAEALINVANTLKVSGDKYGQFGLGFMSPLKKCEAFEFTTKFREEPDTDFRTWLFSSEIIGLQDLSEIKWSLEEGMLFISDSNATVPTKLRNREPVPWRTRVRMRHVTKDKRIAHIDMDELVTEIGRRFRDKILENDVDIKVSFLDENGRKELTRTVSPQRYQGRPLDAHTTTDNHAGTTEFQMFLALKGSNGRQGRVEFSTRAQKGLRQRLTDDQFKRCIAHCGIPMRSDVLGALGSGVFEGEVIAQHVTLNPNRTSFVSDDALWGFCGSIERWFDEVGKRHYEKVLKENQEYRYVQIGEQVLDFLERLIKSSPGFLESLRSILPAGITISRAGTGGGTPPELPEPKKQSECEEEEKNKKPLGPEKPKPDDPSKKPKGKVVGGTNLRGGLGLRFEYVEFEMTRQPYELDVDEGVLRFNIHHQFWSYCNPSDRNLRQYITIAAQIALMEARYQDGGGPMLHHCLYDILRVQVMNIVNHGFLAGTPGAAIRELIFDA